MILPANHAVGLTRWVAHTSLQQLASSDQGNCSATAYWNAHVTSGIVSTGADNRNQTKPSRSPNHQPEQFFW